MYFLYQITLQHFMRKHSNKYYISIIIFRVSDIAVITLTNIILARIILSRGHQLAKFHKIKTS